MNIRPIQLDLSKYKDKLRDINIFQEAVFEKGKSKLKKIDEAWGPIQAKLKVMLDRNGKDFDPNKFYKDPIWKPLEDAIQEAFNFRYVEVAPVIEKAYQYDKDRMFVYVNAGTVAEQRYAIDGIITNEGFYDKTKSLVLQMVVGNQLLLMLEPEELTAIFLHEMGHNIDPAIIDINYAQINDYVKYIQDTDKDKFKKEQKKNFWMDKFTTLVSNRKKPKKKLIEDGNIIVSLVDIILNIPFVVECLAKFLRFCQFHNPFNTNTKEVAKKLVAKTKENIKEKGVFSKYNSTEGFADNLPRMYGYGKALLSGLNKFDKLISDEQMKKIYGKDILTRSNIEKARTQFFSVVIDAAISDVHKTTVHRYYSILKEYYKDLKNATIPSDVKKQIKKDLEDILALGDTFFKSPDEVRNKIYLSIFNAIKESDPDSINNMILIDDKTKKFRIDDEKIKERVD